MADTLTARASSQPSAVTRELSGEAHGLVQRFGDLEAVSDVSFSVIAGEVFAFLGDNGAGKSTTIKVLCTLARPTSGHATVAGFDVATRAKAVRRRIGLDPQTRALMWEDVMRMRDELFGHVLPLAAEIGIVAGFAVAFLSLAIHAFGRPE